MLSYAEEYNELAKTAHYPPSGAEKLPKMRVWLSKTVKKVKKKIK